MAGSLAAFAQDALRQHGGLARPSGATGRGCRPAGRGEAHFAAWRQGSSGVPFKSGSLCENESVERVSHSTPSRLRKENRFVALPLL